MHSASFPFLLSKVGFYNFRQIEIHFQVRRDLRGSRKRRKERKNFVYFVNFVFFVIFWLFEISDSGQVKTEFAEACAGSDVEWQSPCIVCYPDLGNRFAAGTWCQNIELQTVLRSQCAAD